MEKVLDSKVEGCEFKSHTWHGYFETSAISFISLYLCHTDETLQAVGPFYLGYMAGEVKYPAQGHTCETHFRQNDNF